MALNIIEAIRDAIRDSVESDRIARKTRKMAADLEKKKKRRNVPESEYLTEMKDNKNVVEFEDLHSFFFTDDGIVKAVDGVSFDIPRGQTVGVVGESGCGKSVTSLSLMQLLVGPQGQVVSGAIRFNDGNKVYDITKTPQKIMKDIRGGKISMIFQEPMTSLNPVIRIGDQVDEIMELHMKKYIKDRWEEENKDSHGIYNQFEMKRMIRKRTCELLEMVGIAGAEGICEMFPHELSGGMRQRVMIAMALSCQPELIIADEPTTALDVTIQAQILDLMKDLKKQINSSIMLITHDLGVVAEMADYVVVMYAGRVVEKGLVREVFHSPAHPYTSDLMRAKPVINNRVAELYTIPGKVPNPINMPNYCYFRDRCSQCTEKCGEGYPAETSLSPTHKVSCFKYTDQKKGE